MGTLVAGMKSGKTTAIGALIFVQAFLGSMIAQVDGNPATVPEWNNVIEMGMVALGFLLARGAEVTSEASGAKK